MAKRTLVVHNDRFHADDVFATATLKIIYENDLKIIRTRDEKVIESADIVVDVGHEYDPNMNRFDHHQKGGSGKRENGIPYAAFGLIWKHFKDELGISDEAHEMIDERLVQVVDATDNGFAITKTKIEGVKEYVLDSFVKAYNPSWKDEAELFDIRFDEILKVFVELLKREIKLAEDKVEAIGHVEKAYKRAKNKKIVILPRYYPWGNVIEEKPDVRFVISPSNLKDTWRIQSIQGEEFGKFRAYFPKNWEGLQDTQLQDVTGFSDAIFVHRTSYIAVAGSKETAIKMAELALKDKRNK